LNLTDIIQSLRQIHLLEGGSVAILLRLVETGIGLILLWLLQKVIKQVVNRQIAEVERRHQVRGWVRIGGLVLATVFLILLWFPNGQTVLQVLALLAAGLALTLSRPISNLLGWVVILSRAPFRVGDRIEVGAVAGDVIDIGPLFIHLLEIRGWVDADQSTGRVVHLPNSVVFDTPIINFTEGFSLIWDELTVVLTHDSDWERAQALLLELAAPLYEQVEPRAMATADQMGRRYAYQRGITTPFVYIKLLRDGIQLSLRYLSEVRRRRGHRHDLTSAFLHAIRREPTIRLAVPAYRILVDEATHQAGKPHD
jgi:small-conductance mechanosensitive channel